jgi:cysteine sulfinate desulfinase/cysteine desulfurase-like protein
MGAACGCNKPEPSKVLTAMGSSPKFAKNCLRISAGRLNTLGGIIKARELIIVAAKKAQQSG